MVELKNPKLKLDSKLLVDAVIRLIKQDISKKFKQTRKITDEDWEFCEKIDWHPIDELPMKESFIKELEEARHEPTGKVYNSIKEFNDWCDKI